MKLSTACFLRTRLALGAAVLVLAVAAGPAQAHNALEATVPAKETTTVTVQTPAQTGSATPSPAPDASQPSSTPAPATSTTPEQVKPNDDNAPMAVGIAAAILVVAAAVLFIAQKRRDKNTRA
ncbi:hypothetical protein [Paenarthrobacter histidinolovorans]|uniref:LPXTG cell wall anchor domain-containing protein n=1 Tax=Paenarthrobacter histidinolovorans TaxID=43664 RepID=A0ABW8NB97_9MICC